MGLLASHLPLSAEFELRQLWPALIESECTVRDVVRFAGTCRAARAFVCTCAPTLTRPQLERLLLSLPVNRTQLRDDCYLALKVGDIVWNAVEDGRVVRLQRLEYRADPGHYADWGYSFHNGATVLFGIVAPEWVDQLNHKFNINWPQFQKHTLQWYPLLDPALRAVCARLEAERCAALLAEQRIDVESLERARKRPRV